MYIVNFFDINKNNTNKILMSIKPKYAKLIYDGKKTIELRKTFPQNDVAKREETFCVYLYESGTGMITGKFYFNPAAVGNINNEDEVSMKKLTEAACVSEDELIEYVGNKKFYAWHIENAVKYNNPIPIVKTGYAAPQSWIYYVQKFDDSLYFHDMCNSPSANKNNVILGNAGKGCEYKITADGSVTKKW